MKNIFLLLLSFNLLFAEEENSESTITVHVTASVEVPADMVIFRITLKVERRDPQEAFNEHKDLETKLLEMVSQFQIPDSNITYTLLNLHSYKRTRSNEPIEEDVYYYSTGQTVTITFYDVKSYLKFQIDLLKSGFHQFSSEFSSTHLKGLKEAGYKKAFTIAKENASLISKNMGKNLGPIKQVVTETGDRFRFELPILKEIQMDKTSNLTDIKQTVSTQTKLRVVYQVL